MRSTVAMNADGRLVVPHEIREAYNIKHGDLVEIQIKPVSVEDTYE